MDTLIEYTCTCAREQSVMDLGKKYSSGVVELCCVSLYIGRCLEVCLSYTHKYTFYNTTYRVICMHLQCPRCVQSGRVRQRPPGLQWHGTEHTSHSDCDQSEH